MIRSEAAERYLARVAGPRSKWAAYLGVGADTEDEALDELVRDEEWLAAEGGSLVALWSLAWGLRAEARQDRADGRRAEWAERGLDAQGSR